MAENTTKDIWNDDDGAKEPPKKRRMLRKFLIFLLVLIAVLGLVLVAAWRDGTGFDALRRYFAYGTEAVGGEVHRLPLRYGQYQPLRPGGDRLTGHPVGYVPAAAGT